MTPQQKKADELVERFRNFEYEDSEDTVIHKNPYKAAIQCAIICVEEILKENPIVPLEYMLEGELVDKSSEYWQSVLNELKSRL